MLEGENAENTWHMQNSVLRKLEEDEDRCIESVNYLFIRCQLRPFLEVTIKFQPAKLASVWNVFGAPGYC